MSKAGRSLLMGVVRTALFLAAMPGQALAAEQAAPPAVSRAVEVPPPAGWTPGAPLFSLEGDGPAGARPQVREAPPAAIGVRRAGRPNAQRESSARRLPVTPDGKARANARAGKVMRQQAPRLGRKPTRQVAASTPVPTSAKTTRKAPRHAAPRAASPKKLVRAKGAGAANPSRASRPPLAQWPANAPRPKRKKHRVSGAVPGASAAKQATRSPRHRAPSPGAEQGAKRTVRRSG